MGRLGSVALVVMVAGCGSKVDLGDSKKGVNEGSGGSRGSVSEDAGGGLRSGDGGERAADAGGKGGRATASNGGQVGAGGHVPNVGMPPPTGSGGTPAAPHDAGAQAVACRNFPPEPDPIPLMGTAEQNCAEAATATDWGLPLAGLTEDPTDRNPSIVGRWVPCGSGRLSQVDADGIEFGGNGRFRMLNAADGGLTERSETGSYYLFTTQMGPSGPVWAQLNLTSPSAPAGVSRFEMRPNYMAFKADGVIYARTEPSPETGRDNPIQLHGSRCGLAGTWDTTMVDPFARSAALWFDDQGHFVGGAQDSDVCSMPLFHGTYELKSDDTFVITTAVNNLHCAWWFDMGFSAAFSSDCNAVTLTEAYDNCTGGGYLTGLTTKLARRAVN